MIYLGDDFQVTLNVIFCYSIFVGITMKCQMH